MAKAFTRLVLARRAAGRFDAARALPDGALEQCLALAQRAPSSFNLQPYVAVAVRGRRAQLAECMVGKGNVRRVLDAPATVVFGADLQPAELVPRVAALRGGIDGDAEAFDATLWLRASALAGLPLGPFGHALRRWATGALSSLTPSPQSDAPHAWAYKNTMPAVQTFMLACEAHGLATHPMEGLDAARVCEAVGLPAERYAVPCVVSVGHALERPQEEEEEGEGGSGSSGAARRFPPQSVVFQDRFGAPLPNVPDLSADADAAQQRGGETDDDADR